MLDLYYLGDGDYVRQNLQQLEGLEDSELVAEKEKVEAFLLQDQRDVQLITKILSISTPSAERKSACQELRSITTSLRPEAFYAMGLCSLEGDLCENPAEMSEFSYSLSKLKKFNTPAARTLRLLLMIAGGRYDLASSEFSQIVRKEPHSLNVLVNVSYASHIVFKRRERYQRNCASLVSVR